MVIDDHTAISLRVRPQPVHKPDVSSMTQIFVHGLSIGGIVSGIGSFDVMVRYIVRICRMHNAVDYLAPPAVR